MAVYKGPVKDIDLRPERSARRREPRQAAGLRGRHARHHPGDPRGGGQALRERAVPAQPHRRRGRLPLRERRGAHAQGLQGGLRPVPRGRLDGRDLRSRVRRPGPAGDGRLRAAGDVHRVQPVLLDVSGPEPRRLRGAGAARLGRAQEALPAQAHRRHLVGHDVPDRAPLRHRSRHAAHQGRAAGRRQLLDHRHQDLHLGRRARPHREHPPSRAGAPARTRRAAPRASRCSWCRSSCPRPTAASASATASAAARSSTRWASRPTRPAS